MGFKLIWDRTAGWVMLALTVTALFLVLVIGMGLVVKSLPILEDRSLWSLLTGSVWKPLSGEFGFLPFIMGSVWVTGLAILWTLPVALLTAIFLTEHARAWVRKAVYPVLDILAGLPSVVYGVWGVLVVVPWIADRFSTEYSTGYTVLAGAVVLGIMVLPLMVSLFVELFSATPRDVREASLALGATEWQTTKFVLLRRNVPGIVATVVLSVSRAMGETIAVLMVCGSVVQIPASPLDAGYPLPALIANNYGEMMSMPLYESALMFAALILFVVVVVFNIVSRLVLRRIEKRFI